MAKVVNNVAEPLDESLEVLQPEEQFVEIDGVKIFVKPYTFGKLLKALKHLSNLSYLFDSEQELENNLLEAISKHGDDVTHLISLSTDIPVEMFDEIDAEKGLDLAIMTYKVNESFFVKNLLPKLQELFPSDSQTPEPQKDKSKALTKKAGSTSSKS
jgi:hypothetical protein